MAAAATVVLLGGCGTAQPTAPVSVPTTRPTLCPEFPPRPSTPDDPEGWWSSTPADANGNVLTDPADWPAQLREHPRTLVLDVATGRVISSWDRRTCGPIPDFRPPTGLSGHQVVVLDADSGAVLEAMPSRAWSSEHVEGPGGPLELVGDFLLERTAGPGLRALAYLPRTDVTAMVTAQAPVVDDEDAEPAAGDVRS